MKPKEVNTFCARLWLGAFIIALIYANGWFAYKRMQNKNYRPLNPNIVSERYK